MTQTRPERLGIVIPCRSEINAVSFGMLMQAVLVGGVWWSKRFPKNGITLTTVARAHVVHARTDLVLSALADELDYLLWFDDDMVPPSDCVERLFKALDATPDADYVGAVAYKKVEPYSPCVFKRDADGKAFWVDPEPPRIVQADYTGFSNLLMRGPAMRALWAESGGQAFAMRNDMGEDAMWFAHASALGQKLYIDTSIEVGHVGPYVFGSDAFRAFAAAHPAVRANLIQG